MIRRRRNNLLLPLIIRRLEFLNKAGSILGHCIIIYFNWWRRSNIEACNLLRRELRVTTWGWEMKVLLTW
jgi:hypothetical protein